MLPTSPLNYSWTIDTTNIPESRLDVSTEIILISMTVQVKLQFKKNKKNEVYTNNGSNQTDSFLNNLQ